MARKDLGENPVDSEDIVTKDYVDDNISDFETTTELNSRDTANRDRANHTGNQPISSVANLQSELDAKASDNTAVLLASDYSATGDGSTDDTTALQNALNDLNTLGYGALDLEGKTYVTTKLSLKPQTGITNGRLKLKDSANDYILSLDGHASRYQSDWYVGNVIFDCNEANNATTAGGILVYANGSIYDRPLIERVKIVNVRSVGINFTGNGTTPTIQPRLLHVTIDGPTTLADSKGIYLSTKVYDASFVSVDVGRCDVGIDIDGSAKIRFTDVRTWGNESVGTKMTNVVDFVGANCESDKNFGHGVYTWDSTRIHFVGSAISNNSYEDTANEFGLGAGHGTTATYDGVVAEGTSEIYMVGSRLVNEDTAYQRYGLSSQGSSTIYFDGTTKFHNNNWGTTTGNVKSAQELGRLEFNNDAFIDPQTATRFNMGFASDVGAGFEFYTYTDTNKPGKFAAVYGGGVGQGSVGFTHYDGSNFVDTMAVDATGNLAVTGTVDGRDVSVDGSKLDGIETGAEVNVGDEFNNSGTYAGLRAQSTTKGDVGLDNVPNTDATDRANHTGTQAQSTVTNLTSDLADKVQGPDSSTDNAIARYDGTTGKLVQDSGITISDGSGFKLPSTGYIQFGNDTSTVYVQDDYVSAPLVFTDEVQEKTTSSGVTIDSVLLKDGEVDGRDVSVDGSRLDGITDANYKNSNTTKTDVGLSNVPNTDATQRANHTGTQTMSTVSDAGDLATLDVAGLNDIEYFTSSGTWTKPAGLKFVIVEVTGGGGGGGGTNVANRSASGGGAGGYALAKILASSLGSTETVTIGTGGSGGASSGSTPGSDGSNSSFGTHAVATAGTGAGQGVGGAYYIGGPGGVGTTGDLLLSGATGGGGSNGTAYIASGYGGGNRIAPQASAGAYSGTGQDGQDGRNYGGGGGGGTSVDGTGKAGGAGADGIVIVHEYF